MSSGMCVNQKSILMALLFLALVGCASTSEKPGTQEHNPDPFEKVNRVTFAFNDVLDRWLLKPVAKGYQFVAPNFVETGVSNFFSNLSEVPDVINGVLQWKWAKAGNDMGRLLINSTVGVAGLFDVAKHAGLEVNGGESLGQTLSYWGVAEGPYIVIPFFGPATVTDAVTLPISWYLHPITYVSDPEVRLGLNALNAVQTRAQLLDAEKLISGDRYLFIRDVYLQRREHLVNDGEIDIDDIEFDLEGFDEDFESFDEDFDEEF